MTERGASTVFDILTFFGSAKVQSRDMEKLEPKSKAAAKLAGTAIVDEMIKGPDQTGRVYFDSTWWPARCDRPIVLLPGESVRVVGIDKITLVVEPFN